MPGYVHESRPLTSQRREEGASFGWSYREEVVEISSEGEELDEEGSSSDFEVDDLVEPSGAGGSSFLGSLLSVFSGGCGCGGGG